MIAGALGLRSESQSGSLGVGHWIWLSGVEAQ